MTRRDQRGDGADRRVTRERQLVPRREDAHAVVGAGGRRRCHEGRLGEVRLARDRLHLVRAECAGFGHDRDGVTGERNPGEDVDLEKPKAPHGPRPAYSSSSPSPASSSAAGGGAGFAGMVVVAPAGVSPSTKSPDRLSRRVYM